MGIQDLIICFIFISLTVLSTTLTCFALIWFLNFYLGVLFFSKLLVSIMPIISDEQICPRKKMKIFMVILCRILIVKGKYLFRKWSLTQKSMLTNDITVEKSGFVSQTKHTVEATNMDLFHS